MGAPRFRFEPDHRLLCGAIDPLSAALLWESMLGSIADLPAAPSQPSLSARNA
jgi:hypothetical protein